MSSTKTKHTTSEENEDEEVVEKIVNHVYHKEARVFEYCVKWKGFDSKYNTWHLQKDLSQCKDLISAYWETKKKGKPKKTPQNHPPKRKIVPANEEESENEEEENTKESKKEGKKVRELQHMIDMLQKEKLTQAQPSPPKPKSKKRRKPTDDSSFWEDTHDTVHAPSKKKLYESENESSDDPSLHMAKAARSSPPAAEQEKSALANRVCGYRSSEEIEQDRMLLNALTPQEYAKFANAKMHGKQVHSKCIYSTSILHPCHGRKLVHDDDEDDQKSSYFTYANATWVHMSHMGNPFIREKPGKEAVRILKKNYGMCGHCISGTDRDHYINVMKPCQSCCLCKKNSSGLKKDSITHVAICSDCMKVRNQDGGKYFILPCLKPLLTVFKGIHFRIIKERFVRDQSSLPGEDTNSRRYADQVLQFEKDGYIGIIIIERDENQHMERDKKDEKKKMIDQLSGIVLSALQLQKNKSMHKIKCWFIRYNPYGKYRVNSDREEQSDLRDYSEQMRLMMLREWIVWYIHNISQVRHCMCSYMWYNYSHARRLYPYKMVQENEKFPGKNIIYEAPRDSRSSDWAFSIDPHDVIESNMQRGRAAADEFIHMNRHKVDVDSIKPSWNKENEKQHAMFPSEIDVRIRKGLTKTKNA